MAGQSVSKQRQHEALQMLAEGWGTSELVAELALRWGCSRRTARRCVYRAHGKKVNDREKIENHDLLASCIARLERVARKAEKAGQSAAAVGAARSLMDLAARPSHHRPLMGRFGRSTWP
jgi:hypothetical protein